MQNFTSKFWRVGFIKENPPTFFATQTDLGQALFLRTSLLTVADKYTVNLKDRQIKTNVKCMKTPSHRNAELVGPLGLGF